jgi:hypothetical protein
MVYMLRNNKTGLWYRKGPMIRPCWVEQDYATTWGSHHGPTSAKGKVRRECGKRNRVIPDMTIVEYALTPTGNER